MIDTETLLEAILVWRNVDIPCDKCGGMGVRAYSDTSTWRGGVGGQMITSDVCDHCWGSGDKNRHGANLKKMHNHLKPLINHLLWSVKCGHVSLGYAARILNMDIATFEHNYKDKI